MKRVGARIMKKSKKGEMGIGTMILFIAMVLVAAVAAALLISTAGSLNQQAQETGRLAESEVSSGFQVVEVYGVDDDATADIEELYIKVRLNAGSDPIDLDNVIIEVTGETFEANLVDGDGSASASAFGSEELRDPDETWTTGNPIVSQGCLIKLHIDIDAITGDAGLAAQDQVTVKIIPKHGASTLEIVNVPEALIGEYIPLA